MSFDTTNTVLCETLHTLYGANADLKKVCARWNALKAWHQSVYHSKGEELRFFSAPGRVEVIGNHTDHNKGKVVAAAVTLDTIAAARKVEEPFVTLHSRGYKQMVRISLSDLSFRLEEKNTTSALVRGILYAMQKEGKALCGLEICVDSLVASGSGLSSSAAFEVLVVSIVDAMCPGKTVTPIRRAQIGQFAENEYFLKPSGLMDQAASSLGGLTMLDFEKEETRIESLSCDFASQGLKLCVVATDSSHDGLTEHYASITQEMRAVASALHGMVLRETKKEEVLRAIPMLRKKLGDRAVLRALHFFDENERVENLVEAVRKEDFPGILAQMRASGESSARCLQNIYVPGSTEQALLLALELSKDILGSEGTYRIHGGGFAGTILAIVPDAKLAAYCAQMEALFGANACTVLDIRPVGACEIVC